MDRRSFLRAMTAATLGAGHFSWGANTHRIEKIGIQLFTVQVPLKQDFEGTLEKIAAMGYREVEFGSYMHDKSPQYVRTVLDRLGLVSPSHVFPYEDFVNDWPKVTEWCRALGHHYVVVAMVDARTADDWKHMAEWMNRMGEHAKKEDIQFCYHNHSWEFVPLSGGRLPYDILLEESDPGLVKFEMDLAWISVGRADPLKYFARYPGRFPLVHVKGVRMIPATPNGPDFKASDVIEVGDGVIDWRRIFTHAKQAGIKHYYVEQDNPKAPLRSVEISYRYLAQLRF